MGAKVPNVPIDKQRNERDNSLSGNNCFVSMCRYPQNAVFEVKIMKGETQTTQNKAVSSNKSMR